MAEYNGWTNYETWLVNLWLTNDKGSDSYWRGRAEEIADQAESDEWSTRQDVAARELADTLKDEHEQAAEEAVGNSGVFADLIGAALSDVNWREIAEGLLEGYDFAADESGD